MRFPSTMLAAAVFLTPALAYSQPVSYPGNPGKHPVIYVCTADAQVVRITTTSSGAVDSAVVFANGDGFFDDCVVGRSGELFIANGRRIVKVDLSATSLPTGTTTVATLPEGVRARGLAFNVEKLYVTTEASVTYSVDVSAGTYTPLFTIHDPETEEEPPPPLVGSRGLAFDVAGNMDIAVAGQVWQALGVPYVNAYPGPASYLADVPGAYEIAFNTCRQIVVGSTTQRAIRRLTSTGPANTNISFPSQYRPYAFEIDWSNRIYMVAAKDDTGTSAIVRVATPNVASGAPGSAWLQTCGDFVTSTILELKTSGNGSIPGLVSTKAVGLAIGQSAHKMQATLPAPSPPNSPPDCSVSLDFGYHYYKLADACASQPYQLTVTAFKSRPVDVTFDPSVFSTNTAGISYSPNGGFLTELTFVDEPNVGELTGNPLAQYYFFTQQAIANVGVAKANNEFITSSPSYWYNFDVGTEFWDVGFLDGGTGDRERDWSKRVVYTANAVNCTLGDADPPLRGDLPLINSDSVLKVAVAISGPDCGSGVMRLSVARIDMNSLNVPIGFTPRPVVSNNNQTDNVMDLQTNKISYQLVVSALEETPPAQGEIRTYLATVNGPFGNKSFYFTVTK